MEQLDETAEWNRFSANRDPSAQNDGMTESEQPMSAGEAGSAIVERAGANVDSRPREGGFGALGPLFAQIGRGYPVLTVVARFPFAMVVVSVLTVVVSVSGSMELGGVTSAMVGLGMVCFGPLIGAAADRFGHRPTLLVFAALNSAALGLLAWIVYTPAPIWVVMSCAFLIGGTVPQTSPMSRTRLVGNINRAIPPEQRSRTITAALAFESAADEVSFVLGPVVVGLLATLFTPWAPVAGAAVLTLLFVSAFALHRTAVSAVSAAERASTLAPAGHLFRPSLLIVVVGAISAGLCFGAMLTSLTSFMNDRGMTGQAGLVYSCMAFSSGMFAIAMVWLPDRLPLQARWLIFSGITGVGTLTFLAADSVAGAALSLLIMGAGVGPLLVTLFSLGTSRTPVGRSATVMTMINSGIMIGQAIAGAVVGIAAESLGTQAALFGPLLATAITFTAGLINLALTPGKRRAARD